MMKIGFIGAGKVGFSLGKYFQIHGQLMSGYYDKDMSAAREAALFTKTKAYEQLEDIVRESDALFLTVPDGVIKKTWEYITQYSIQNKVICHCSGALTSAEAFPGIGQYHSYGYSIHPLFAVSDKLTSYKELSNAYFTIEGDNEYLEQMKELFISMGNHIEEIAPEKKILYHTAAATCSNQVIALAQQASDLLSKCGLSKEFSSHALLPILLGNVEHIVEGGCVSSLTGPVERNDIGTVKKHLRVLEGEDKLLYSLLSKKLVEIAKKKHEETDYRELQDILNETIYQ
ncbi:MAG: Rossmann-like and DUF2520 domain-containing protein [Lachnospiraceae bacterium]